MKGENEESAIESVITFIVVIGLIGFAMYTGLNINV